MGFDDDDPEDAEPRQLVPEVVLNIQRHARRHGCDYVLIDRDGPIDDDLDVFYEEGPASPTVAP